MRTLIEIGNTTGKLYEIGEAGRVNPHARFAVADSLETISQFLAKNNNDIILAGSGPADTIARISNILSDHQRSVLQLDRDISLPFKSRYTPGQAGIDRLANVAAAINNEITPCILIDAGSAITVDLISGKDEFLGGSIMPGLYLQAQSLNRGTAGLPLVACGQVEPLVIPADTTTAIQHGIAQGSIGAVEHLVALGRQHLSPACTIIFTGGDGKWLFEQTKFDTARHDEHLTAMGLYLLARYQEAGDK